ncbi:GNAT family N-acetyltransferase [Thermoflavimicrobium dichotomicum]|uniref:Acetyltransferase (GNAT) domain-containing protein n=1 Tax=Thermoflavimicrobium dichotomicum TaxID=46223 RepID=A0A1I3T6X0_9BACL|nr:GNAT family N-acetyltransferase [Thermoflavimicrobium dichotomicum]SFJ66039.1 Acetyltransferase (GNAT) domain-containing protein [Thermoflavimicrobium dichotomicum]
MNQHLRLFDKENLTNLNWKEIENGTFAQRYHTPFLQKGTQTFIANVQTELMLLQVDSLLLPLTVNQKEYENSYVVSPYTHYVTYAKKELAALKKYWLSLLLHPLLSGLDYYLRACQINRVVIVNNWLVSTNLHPAFTTQQVECITSFLTKRFPDHAILFRSVNEFSPAGQVNIFLENHYIPIPSRQVYFYDPAQESTLNSKTRWLLKRDKKLFEQSGYQVVEAAKIPEQALPRLIELYNLLYLKKYSIYNPQFQLSFLTHAIEQKFLHVYALQKDKQIDGVIGYFIQDQTMTTPFFGYDIHLRQQIGLYRMLSSLLVQKAHEHQLLLHQSSGAASFKRCRGACAALEYTMAYVDHLPKFRRQAWHGLSSILQKLAVPIIQKYKL